MVLVPETRELFTDMVVADNLLLGAMSHRRNSTQVKRGYREGLCAVSAAA